MTRRTTAAAYGPPPPPPPVGEGDDELDGSPVDDRDVELRPELVDERDLSTGRALSACGIRTVVVVGAGVEVGPDADDVVPGDV
ncbi:hypothetical protein [Luteipulveratus mongoliensis]|uniref:hypothetical protein n=1 Tax=Luteipulveratus mongoliensis TaxID=571913 RepID=UPI0012ED8143|nr:hypothetical protein [Luteipulveratus mongoliensis]